VGLPGRRIWTIAALALGVGLAVPGAALADGGASAAAGPERPPKAKLITDGLLTVGAQETLRVIHVPRKPHRRLKAFLYPPSTATICEKEAFDLGLFSVCLPQPLRPVPGTRPLKANKKNRGSLTFVMPSAYEYIDPYDPTQSHPITLVDGQAVYVEIDITWRPDAHTIAEGPLAYNSVRVQVPAPPAS
jgi:hypothetical protein